MSRATNHEVSTLDLPFVRYDNVMGSTNSWNVPKDKEFFNACTTGVFYAREFLKYLRDRECDGTFNSLLRIVADMDHREHGEGRGFQVGFLNTLEELLVQLAKSTDFETQLNEMIAQSVEGESEADND